LHAPLRLTRVALTGGRLGFAVNGTPADCIKLGVLEVLSGRPHLVLSGINVGANVGANINYSGTVAAAREAALYGIPAIAVSVQQGAPDDLEAVAQFIENLAEQVHSRGLPFGTILNINFPDVPVAQATGIRISRQKIRPFEDYLEKRTDPRNRVYYWQGRNGRAGRGHPDTDETALEEDCIVITPIQCDMTDYRLLDDLRRWNWEEGQAPRNPPPRAGGQMPTGGSMGVPPKGK
jgi:5'-nucleotidase